jgi:hypothetical protein
MSIRHIRQLIRCKGCPTSLLAYAHTPPVLPFLHPHYLRLSSTNTLFQDIHRHPRSIADGATSGSLADYCLLRETSSFKLEDFPLSEFKRAVRQAVREQSIKLLDLLGADIINAKTSSLEARIQYTYALLEITAKDRLLSLNAKADLARFLMRSVTNIETIPPRILGICAGTIADLHSSGQMTANFSLLKAITPYLLEDEPVTPTKFIAKDIWDALPSEPFTHKPHTWSLFLMVVGHLNRNDIPSAANLFTSLMQTERLAPQALRKTEEDENSTDTELMIMSVLIRSCLVWGWRNRSLELLKSMLASRDLSPSGSEQTHSPIISVAVDSLRTLVRTAQLPEHVYHCTDLLCNLAELGVPAATLDPVIITFYRKAHVTEEQESARTAFKALQHHGKKNGIAYTPPSGGALIWLLKYLSQKIYDMHSARQLAHAVNQANFVIHDVHVLSLLNLFTQGGFLDEAEDMWRRYTEVETDRRPTDAEKKLRDRIYGSSVVMSGFIRAFVRGSERARRQAEAKSIYRSTYIAPVNAPKKGPDELHEFALLVLEKYVENNQPLNQASRIDVSALARAYFILGQTSAAVRTMKSILRRNIIPTAQELSITLASMANLSPRRASRMLQRMIDKGIQPEAIDFSAIIHEASLRGDDMLVGALVTKARELGHEQLSKRGIHSLIQFSLRFNPAKNGERPAEEAETLRRVLRMVRALADARVDTVLTPWLGTKCARACVRVNQGELAYEFWRLLVSEKEDRNHLSQQVLRARIVRVIQQEIAGREISESRGRQMIDELRGWSRTRVGSSEGRR